MLERKPLRNAMPPCCLPASSKQLQVPEFTLAHVPQHTKPLNDRILSLDPSPETRADDIVSRTRAGEIAAFRAKTSQLVFVDVLYILQGSGVRVIKGASG